MNPVYWNDMEQFVAKSECNTSSQCYCLLEELGEMGEILARLNGKIAAEDIDEEIAKQELAEELNDIKFIMDTIAAIHDIDYWDMKRNALDIAKENHRKVK